MTAIETIATNIPVVYVGVSLVYYVRVGWEKCKELFFWLTTPDELLEEPEKVLQRIDKFIIVTEDEKGNVVYV